jgi:hypothetical protein
MNRSLARANSASAACEVCEVTPYFIGGVETM